ncbi:Predicted kinase, aminoglycoside phosphotransferase (APT) family [Quadrisphaera granulorum]|uniref:Aminoglycoside phosphotransferase (APT) family kinase protein n=1 Tax=Quadrisphaera granulorum TaxID=317664 RepID=A0A315ZVG4_9ACTN|nr:phosphotransferase [Quadrisphaera granulorum]PWJ48858.1 aminoglycoside phosphotransferase (APT) family kinase protein [Quadrisphaera granulorum]SZE98340.1 Predicted kinase, aminoglycoside phosphotransferase (APT) family [Quadrisphaera granulorum]
MTDERSDRETELAVWAAVAFPGRPWHRARHHHGAFHDVLLIPHVGALRVPIGDEASVRAAREVEVLRAVGRASLGIVIPELLTGIVESDGRCGYLVEALPGGAAPEAPWSRHRPALVDVLAALSSASIDVPLPPPRSWCGGADFPAVVTRDLLPRLGGSAAAAEQAVQALADLPPPRRPGLVHGDFGAHNLLWAEGRPTGLIDWDHACIGDVAIDIAPLVGAHGSAAVSTMVDDDDVLRRALAHRATLPLQVAAAAHLAGRISLRDHALANFSRRCNDGTLHDPDGAEP